MESYSHQAAGLILASWFRETAKTTCNDIARFGSVTWNVHPAIFDVRIERPILADGTGAMLAVTRRYARQIDRARESWTALYGEQNALRRNRAIVDVIILSSFPRIFEVVHTHPLSTEKEHFIRAVCWGRCAIWEVPAKWILGQRTVPVGIPANFRKRHSPRTRGEQEVLDEDLQNAWPFGFVPLEDAPPTDYPFKRQSEL